MAGHRTGDIAHVAGTDFHTTDPDGWTLRITEGTRGAHIGHTVAITPGGPVSALSSEALGWFLIVHV
ncbi:hypothetical protein [Kitasatospora purpeofusca]|uniref:hypothetical protein n=1 Tax=Kitasatospora purpeofusca TaxID=67352 RepID=UPI003F4ABBA2